MQSGTQNNFYNSQQQQLSQFSQNAYKTQPNGWVYKPKVNLHSNPQDHQFQNNMKKSGFSNKRADLQNIEMPFATESVQGVYTPKKSRQNQKGSRQYQGFYSPRTNYSKKTTDVEGHGKIFRIVSKSPVPKNRDKIPKQTMGDIYASIKNNPELQKKYAKQPINVDIEQFNVEDRDITRNMDYLEHFYELLQQEISQIKRKNTQQVSELKQEQESIHNDAQDYKDKIIDQNNHVITRNNSDEDVMYNSVLNRSIDQSQQMQEKNQTQESNRTMYNQKRMEISQQSEGEQLNENQRLAYQMQNSKLKISLISKITDLIGMDNQKYKKYTDIVKQEMQNILICREDIIYDILGQFTNSQINVGYRKCTYRDLVIGFIKGVNNFQKKIYSKIKEGQDIFEAEPKSFNCSELTGQMLTASSVLKHESQKSVNIRLQKYIQNQEAVIDKLQGELASQARELNLQFQRKFKEKDNENLDVRSHMNNLKEELEKMEKNKINQEKQIDVLMTQLKNTDDKAFDLEQDNKRLQDNLTFYINKVQNTESSVTNLQTPTIQVNNRKQSILQLDLVSSRRKPGQSNPRSPSFSMKQFLGKGNLNNLTMIKRESKQNIGNVFQF